MSKAGVSYTYGSTGKATGQGPHQARVIGGQAYSYDANGNLLSGGGRSYTWDAANRPATITANGGPKPTSTTATAAGRPARSAA